MCLRACSAHVCACVVSGSRVYRQGNILVSSLSVCVYPSERGRGRKSGRESGREREGEGKGEG